MTHALKKKATERRRSNSFGNMKPEQVIAVEKYRVVGSNLASQFGRRVAIRRNELRLTQSAMIKRLNHLAGSDLGRSTASVWENGHSEPSISLIHALAKVLRTRPEYLAFGVKMFEAVDPGVKQAFLPDPVPVKKAYEAGQVYRRRQGA